MGYHVVYPEVMFSGDLYVVIFALKTRLKMRWSGKCAGHPGIPDGYRDRHSV